MKFVNIVNVTNKKNADNFRKIHPEKTSALMIKEKLIAKRQKAEYRAGFCIEFCYF